MMSGNVRNDAASMEAGANHVDTVNQALQGELKTVEGLVQGSRDSWEGEAQAAFDQVMLDYKDASNRLHQALEEIEAGIRSNGKNFTAAEEDNKSRVASVGSSLNITNP
ncbi:WXG100 family type VII secretion target [Nocardia cyriacigeorgica]